MSKRKKSGWSEHSRTENAGHKALGERESAHSAPRWGQHGQGRGVKGREPGRWEPDHLGS